MPTEADSLSPSLSIPAGTDRPAPGSWRQVSLFGGLLSVDNGESSVVSVLFPALRTALGLPLAALGALTSVSKLVAVFLGPIWVLVAQRYSRKTVLAVCSGLWGVWTMACGLAQNYVQLLILFTIAAAGVAGGGPLANGLLADLFDDGTRGRASAFLYALAAIGVGVSGPLLGQLADTEDGWRYGFFAAGALQVVAGILVLLFLRDPGVGAAEPQLGAGARPSVRERDLTWARVRELLRNRTLLVICGQRLFTGQFVLLAFGVTFLVEERGLSNAAASTITLPVAVAYIAGTLLGGVITDRLHRRNPRTGRIRVMQCVLFAYVAMAAVTTQITWSSQSAYFLLFALIAAVQSALPGINRPLTMAAVLPELRSAAFALMLSVEAAGWAVTTLCVGFVGDAFGLQTAFLWFVVVLTLIGALLITLLYRTYPRDAAAVQAELDRRSATAATS
ncbi:MFS transporter [Streptomyces sp. NPDC053720]|uniref:MFS transporter n=1 Tax=Streptomyces sp. NPDC053720 TaxID=3154855 RepID=UPI0034271B80